MSRKGNCWDHAVAESFDSISKKERINKHVYWSRELAFADVAGYIELFDNIRRRHRRLGGLSLEQFEAAHASARAGVQQELGASDARLLRLIRASFHGQCEPLAETLATQY